MRKLTEMIDETVDVVVVMVVVVTAPPVQVSIDIELAFVFPTHNLAVRTPLRDLGQLSLVGPSRQIEGYKIG